jgi:hypothetical protein
MKCTVCGAELKAKSTDLPFKVRDAGTAPSISSRTQYSAGSTRSWPRRRREASSRSSVMPPDRAASNRRTLRGCGPAASAAERWRCYIG